MLFGAGGVQWDFFFFNVNFAAVQKKGWKKKRHGRRKCRGKMLMFVSSSHMGGSRDAFSIQKDEGEKKLQNSRGGGGGGAGGEGGSAAPPPQNPPGTAKVGPPAKKITLCGVPVLKWANFQRTFAG